MPITTSSINGYPTGGRIISAQQMLVYKKLGVRFKAIRSETRKIALRNMGFSIPQSKDLLIRDDINSQRIYYSTNKNSIIFYRKHENDYEEIGQISIDKDGYLLKDGKRYKTSAGKKPNCFDKQRYSLDLAQFVEIFGIIERIVRITDISRKIDTNVKGIKLRFSTDPKNLFYDDFVQGRIYIQIRPKGQILFLKKIGESREYIGETNIDKLRSYLEEKKKTSAYIPDLIPEFKIFEARIGFAFKKEGESPVYRFESNGIIFSLSVPKEMIYAPEILAGNLYRREHPNHIEIGIKRQGKFFQLGEIRFDAKGRIPHKDRFLSQNGEPVRRDSGKIQFASLKELVPELASIQKTLEYTKYKSKNKRTSADCRATALGRVFILSANPQNPLTQKVKEGRVDLKITPQEIIVYIDGIKRDSVKKDLAGNIFNKDGSIAFPAEKKRIVLTKIMPGLDMEKNHMAYRPTAKGKKSPVWIKTKGIRFEALLGKTWFFTKAIRMGEVYWHRTGNKIEILKKGLASPIGTFRIDPEQNEILASNGERFPIPGNKKVDLVKCVPALRLEIGRIHDYIMRSGDSVEISFKYFRHSTPRYRAYAMGKIFFINTVIGRNPYTGYVKRGTLKLRVRHDKIQVFYKNSTLGEISLDASGNVLNPDGTIAFPASQHKIDITQLIEKLDTEKGKFTVVRNYAHRNYTAEYAQFKIKNTIFRLSLYENWIYTDDIKKGRIFWKRTGNKVEIRKKKNTKPLGVFFIDESKDELTLEINGTLIKKSVPAHRAVNLKRLFPAFGTKIEEFAETDDLPENFIEMLETHDHEKVYWWMVNNKIEIVCALIQKAENQELSLRDKIPLNKYCYALNIALDRISRKENNIEEKDRFFMFGSVLAKFFRVLCEQMRGARNLNGFRDILDLHSEDIKNYIDRLIAAYGKERVSMELKQIEDGYLWPFISPLFIS